MSTNFQTMQQKLDSDKAMDNLIYPNQGNFMTSDQRLAWERLNKTFNTGIILPKKYGTVEPSLKDAKLYDVPGHLRDWSKDKRKITTPEYPTLEELGEILL